VHSKNDRESDDLGGETPKSNREDTTSLTRTEGKNEPDFGERRALGTDPYGSSLRGVCKTWIRGGELGETV